MPRPMIATIKQYGEIRTGTNYLRALVLRNYPDVQVLSYILGDKHSPPAPFDAIWKESQRAGTDAPFTFVSTATFVRRGAASCPKDRTQQEELARRAPPIAAAYAAGTLGFLVTIKDPYAWVVSVARFKGWLKDEEAQLRDWNLELMREACLGYNRNYRAWFDLVRTYEPQARIVRYEELLADPELVLAEIAARFGWPEADSFEGLPAVVEPTRWDHLPVAEAPERFRPEYYTDGEYLQRLPAGHLRLINELMDWELLAELGYTRR